METKQIRLKDKTFILTITEEQIQAAVADVAAQLTRDYADKNPVFVIVLNGAFMFAGDLLRLLKFPYQIAFTKLSSYQGVSSTGRIIEQLPVHEDVTGRHLVIIEDIVETGHSMQYLKERLMERQPASVEICALSFKPEKCLVSGLTVKYVGMKLPEAFIVGYGLDYDELGREYRDIYALVAEQ